MGKIISLALLKRGPLLSSSSLLFLSCGPFFKMYPFVGLFKRVITSRRVYEFYWKESEYGNDALAICEADWEGEPRLVLGGRCLLVDGTSSSTDTKVHTAGGVQHGQSKRDGKF